MKAKESGTEQMTNSHKHYNDKADQSGKIDFKYLNEVEYYLYNGSDPLHLFCNRLLTCTTVFQS